MDRENELAWCRSLFATISEGGVWGVPRSGLTFKKRGERFLLIDQFPWHPERGGTADEWRAYQDDDYEAIRERFVAAGINVEKEEDNSMSFPGDIPRDDFYKKAIKPGFPNEMTFVLDVPEELREENKSFSHEGFDQLMENIHSFLLARTLGTWQEKKNAPTELTVSMSLKFKAEPKRDLQNGGPWWHLVDEGNNTIDGSHRHKSIHWPEP